MYCPYIKAFIICNQNLFHFFSRSSFCFFVHVEVEVCMRQVFKLNCFLRIILLLFFFLISQLNSLLKIYWVIHRNVCKSKCLIKIDFVGDTWCETKLFPIDNVRGGRLITRLALLRPLRPL
jgi:hypothetical protein